MVLLAVHYTIHEAQATTQPTLKYNMVTIEWSQICLSNFKHNDTSSCIPVSQVVPFDTSNQHISGKFQTINNQTERTEPQAKNHWLFYQYFKKPVVCVDCAYPGGAVDVIKNIIIVPKNYFIYVDPNENSTNHSAVHVYSDLYIAGCNTADISDINLLNQTIQYFLNDCKGKMPSKHEMIQIKENPFEYNNPFSSLVFDEYKKQLSGGHNMIGTNHTKGGLMTQLCINGHTCDFKDPYRKAGY